MSKKELAIVIFLFLISLTIRLFLLNSGEVSTLSDELVYSKSGLLIYEHFSEGHRGYDKCLGFNYEHPMFVKLLYALSITLVDISGLGLTPLQASRVVSSIIGALTCVVLYLFGSSLFNRRTGIIASLTLSFSTLFLFGTVHALLDSVAAFFVLLSIFLFYLYSKTNKTSYLVLSSISFGLATASKFIGFLTLPVLLVWFILAKETKKRKTPKLFLIFSLIALTTFFVVQPRLWYDPITRLENTWKFNYYHLKTGYFLPIEAISYLPEEKNITPWWLIPKYLFLPQSLFEIVGTILLIPALYRRRLNNESLLVLLLFVIPFFYLLTQPVRLFHYVIFLVPFQALIIGYSYDFLIRSVLRKKSYMALLPFIYLFILHALFDVKKGVAKIKTIEWFNYSLKWALVVAVVVLIFGVVLRRTLLANK